MHKDDNRPVPKKAKKKTKKQIAAEIDEFGEKLWEVKAEVPENGTGMEGRENRVYWPPGMEE